MLRVTPSAQQILSRALHAARRLNPTVIVRVLERGGSASVELAEGPTPGDEPIAGIDGAFVAAGVTGVLDGVEPHDQLVVRPTSNEEG